MPEGTHIGSPLDEIDRLERELAAERAENDRLRSQIRELRAELHEVSDDYGRDHLKLAQVRGVVNQ